MLLSSFELLFEPITPKGLNPSPAVPDPIIVQGYFVTISNVGTNPVDLTLTFNSSLSLQNTLFIFDRTNTFPPGAAKPLNFGSPQNFQRGTVDLPQINPNETVLCLLQPDVATILGNPPDLNKAIFAARGYVDVSAPNGTNTECLISPQHRGTFLNPPTLNVVAQEAYPLQTATGNLFKFA